MSVIPQLIPDDALRSEFSSDFAWPLAGEEGGDALTPSE